MPLVEMISSVNAAYMPSLSKYSHLFFGNKNFPCVFSSSAAEAISLQCFCIIMQRSLLVFNLCSYYVFWALSTWNNFFTFQSNIQYNTRIIKVTV